MVMFGVMTHYIIRRCHCGSVWLCEEFMANLTCNNSACCDSVWQESGDIILQTCPALFGDCSQYVVAYIEGHGVCLVHTPSYPCMFIVCYACSYVCLCVCVLYSLAFPSTSCIGVCGCRLHHLVCVNHNTGFSSMNQYIQSI